MQQTSLTGPQRPLLFMALTLSIPAFYLMLTAANPTYRNIGSALYGIAALLIAAAIGLHRRQPGHGRAPWRASTFDLVLLAGVLASAWSSVPPWPVLEWLLRLGVTGLVFFRLMTLLSTWLAPRHVFQMLAVAVLLLALAGGGFYWLEPNVRSYQDGLWLAFTTSATVVYGDMIPSTPASRIFAVFIVLLGYGVFSVVTASIAALFVSEDEKRFQKELHADIRSLREEIAVLRKALPHADADADQDRNT